MSETLPTHKEANFNDVLAGFERFGSCRNDAPNDLEGLEHYCEALAFSVSDDLIAIQSLLDCDLALSAKADFLYEEARGHSIKNAATRICALAELGSSAAAHIKQLKSQQEGES